MNKINLLFLITLFLSIQTNAGQLESLFPDDPIWAPCARNFDQLFEAANSTGTGGAIILIRSVDYSQDSKIGIGITLCTLIENGVCTRGTVGGCAADIKNVKHSLFKTNKLNTHKDAIACGSYIDYENKTVSESIQIDGTDLSLVYSSNYNSQNPLNRTAFVDADFSNHGSLLSYEASVNSSGSSQSIIPQNIGNSLSRLSYTAVSESDMVQSNQFKSTLLVYFSAKKNYGGIGGGCLIDTNNNPVCQLPYQFFLNVFSQTSNKTIYKPEVWGLSGWTINQHHYFNKDTGTLFKGDGREIQQATIKSIDDANLGQVDVVLDLDTNRYIYIFDQSGRHLETRDVYFGSVIYKFSYINDKIDRITDQLGKQTLFVYNSQQKLEKIISPYGLETLVTVENNQITGVQNSLNQSFEIAYGNYNLMTSFKSINGVITTFAYNSLGEFTSEQKNIGLSQSFEELLSGGMLQFKRLFNSASQEKVTKTFTGEGVNTKKFDGLNREIYTKSNYTNQFAEQILSLNQSQLTQKGNDPTWGQDFAANTKVYLNYFNYNQNGDRIEDFVNVTEYRNYTDNNVLTPSTAEITYGNYTSNNLNNTFLNNNNNTITFVDDLNQSSVINFNNMGLPTQINMANSTPVSYIYNSNNQLERITKGSFFQNYTYDQHGHLASVTDSKNRTTSFINDKQGKVLTKILPNSDQINFEYTHSGEVKKITTPNNQVHNFGFDLGDYISSSLNPNNKNTIFEYDTKKRLQKIIKPSDKEIVYFYQTGTDFLESISTDAGNYQIQNIDQYGRPQSVTSPDLIKLDINWVSDQFQKQSWYDTDGSLLANISYTYHPNRLNLKDILINNQVVATYTYQKDRITQINTATYSYQNNPAQFTENIHIAFQNLISNYTTQDELSLASPSRLVSATAIEDLGSQIFINMKRSFDVQGQANNYSALTVNSSNGVLNSFYQLVPQYDANDRLIQIQKNRKNYINGQEVSSTDFYNQYSYPLGSNNNMKEFKQSTTETGNPQKRTIANHDSEDRLISLRGSIHRDYTYSDDGDLKTMTNCYGTTSYDYDVFGNLKKVTLTDGKVIEYKVDAMNRRVKKLVNGVTKEYYLWYDQIHLAAILDENKVPKLTYIYGPESQTPSYVIKDNTTYRILHDPGLGSIRYIVNPATQQIMQDIEYDEYGNVMKNTNPDFQPLTYAGGLYDSDTKLIRFGARDYDPTVGRWTSKDPIGFAGGDTNLYAYVGGNPMSKIDPTGTSDIDLFSPIKDAFLYDASGNTVNVSGYFSVGGHGSPRGMVNQLNQRISPSQLAAIIKANPGYKGQSIQLNSCSTGGKSQFAGEANFAQQLANILGVNVMGPTDWVYFSEKGNLRIKNAGQWLIFTPSPIPLKQ